MYYVIGVDGGGTKTEAIAIDHAGRKIAQVTGGASNPHSVTYAIAERNIAEVLDRIGSELPAHHGPCRAICLGLAGGGAEDVLQHYTAFIRQYAVDRQMPLAHAILKNDAEIALAAAHGTPYGVIVIAGTGSIAYGITRDGVPYRSGGWGHILGDQGSGYAIGLQTLQAAMLSHDGVLPQTGLIQMIQDKLSLSHIEDLKSYAYQPHIQKQHIAGFAELCIRAAESGDIVARDIIRRSAAELAALVIALLTKDEQLADSPLAIAGSIFTHSTLFREHFTDQVRLRTSSGDIRLSMQPAALGAARLALASLDGE